MKAIEISIGIVFVYLLLSLIATIVMEIFAGYTAQRGNLLKKRIIEILGDKELTKSFFDSPLYQQLHISEGRTPSYISAVRFLEIVLSDVIQGQGIPAVNAIDAILSNPSYQNIPFIKTIQFYWDEAGKDLDKFKMLMAKWYDENMDLLSGAYKRKTQQLLLIFGLGIALVFNANTINIYKTLNQDDQKRAALADMATEMMQTKQLPRSVDTIKTSATADSVLKQIRAYENNLDSIQKKYAAASNVLGLGWDCDCEGNGNWKMSSKESFINYNALLGCPKEKDQVPAIREYFYVVLGWLITAIAISFGSPFWFDVLKSLINIRSAGKSPAEKKA